jgi:peptide methionine sulfoxide reductase MsrB
MMWYAGGVVLLGAALLKNLPTAHSCEYPCVPGSEDIMKPKEHGTSHVPVQDNLRWGCDWKTADRICNYNRRYAEFAGYWEKTTFKQEVKGKKQEKFYDSNTGKLLLYAPVDRTWDDWVKESSNHGWPSFRDSEVNWDNVRVLPDGETVSVDGTHLGHNLPDSKGNRYCLNLVSIAGNPRN